MSFSSELKEHLKALPVRKKCCRRVMDALLTLDFSLPTAAEEMRAVYQSCRCPACPAHFLRALFLCCGSVTDPKKQYHAELSFPREEVRDIALDALASAGLSAKKSARGGRFLLYWKDSAGIEDFLLFIGASSAAFALMNQKIVNELRNDTNRQVNCDTANIERVLAASRKYRAAIDALASTGQLDALPDSLRQTALLKLENPQLSLEALGALLSPPVSKSGVRHRLEKIYQFYLEKNS